MPIKKSANALNRISVEAFKEAEKIPVVIVLDNVRSALNVGSAFRTADAFACAELILCGFTAQPPHREILKTALGSTESVAWRHFDDTIAALNTLSTEGYQICAIEQANNSIPLQKVANTFNKNKKYALIFGNEVDGVTEDALSLADYIVEIPQFGTKHSINVSVTVGIVAWELNRFFRFEK